MKTLVLLLSAATFALPLIVDGAAVPTIKITSPTKASTTSATLTAAGTAKSTIPISAVLYSFNGSAWTFANGTTNWSVPGLTPKAGANVFSAVAIETNSVASKTNTVVFTYIVNQPIAVSTTGGQGTVTLANGAQLQIGKTYKISAKAAKGFGFTGWTGSLTNSSSKLSFVMASNLTLTANFTDNSRPLCVITFPAVKHSVSNSPITVTGRASDNQGVTSVAYQLNGGGWKLATILDGTNWNGAGVELTPGANTIRAFAGDGSGNLSLTNTVAFTYVSNAPPPPVGPAPLSLSGKTAQVSVNGGTPLAISFGDNTFSQDGAASGDFSFAGNYTYTLLSSNMAQLAFSAVTPPQNAGEGNLVTLTFVDNAGGTFTATNGSSGTITFATAAGLAPEPSDAFTVQWVDKIGVTNTLALAGGVFTQVDSDGNVNSGNYVFEPFGPSSVVLSITITAGPLAGHDLRLQLDFFDASTGDISVTVLDNSGNFLASYDEPFTILNKSSAPAGKAPLSVAGLDWSVTIPGKGAFQISFGASTYSQTNSSSQDQNDVGNYIYMRTGPDTAVFKNIQTLPPNNPGNNSDPEKFLVYLNFSKSTAASVISTNTDNGVTTVETGSISLKSIATSAPVSIAGKTAKAPRKGNTDTIVFNTDGTLIHSDSSGFFDSGTYTYTVFSPNCGMAVFNITAGEDAGNTDYVQLTFSSASGGTFLNSEFDPSGNLQETSDGPFTLQ
jgi:uncharacterized repeat protein (TIGR02543 family)